jgi:hypothetical protein
MSNARKFAIGFCVGVVASWIILGATVGDTFDLMVPSIGLGTLIGMAVLAGLGK